MERTPTISAGTILFDMGQIVATPSALNLLECEHYEAGELLRRHSTGDWGECCAEDKKENANSLMYGNRIMSVYTLNGRDCNKVWIITEANRSVTTILLPCEY